MPYGTEIQAKLGVDTSSVGTDLAGAKNVFNKWGQEVAVSGEKHGASFGDKLVGGIEHKIFGARHLSGAIAGALGINVDKIAEHIAEAIVGGSKEGWAEAGRIADENAKLIGKKFELAMSPKGVAENLEKELKRITDQINAIKGERDLTPDIVHGGFKHATEGLDAEDLKKREALEKDRLEIEIRIAEKKKENVAANKELAEASEKEARESKSLTTHYQETHDEINATVLELLKGGLAEEEIIKKKRKLIDLERELRQITKAIQTEDVAYARAEESKQQKKIAQEEKLFSLQRTRFTESKKLQEDQNKLTDRSKLTVGELANLNNGNKGFSLGKSSLDLSFGANEGLSDAQVEAKRKAQKIQELEQEAEQKRLAGDVAGSEAAFGQVGSMRDELVKSGGVKSSEGDKFGELKKQIAEDNTQVIHTLQEIAKIEKGKFVNQ